MKKLLFFAFAISFFQTLVAQTDSGYFRSFDSTRIYYEVSGKGDPIVLIHGFVVNSVWWKKIALFDDLIADGHKVIIIDLRGNGKSDRPHDAEKYANDAEAKDVMQLVNHLKLNSYKVVGYSRGSIIASRLLVLDPRVTKAVLGGMGDGFTNPDWPRRIMFYRGLSGEPIKEVEGLINYIKQAGLDQQALALMQKEQPASLPSELAKLNQPVLLIDGDNDPDNGSIQSLQAMLPHSQLKFVPGDHNTAPRSAAFSKEIVAFLR